MRQELIDLINKKKVRSPVKSYLWRVELPDLNKQTGNGYIDGGFDGNKYEISTRVTNISFPSKQIETDKAMHGNSFWYYAKSEDISTITLEVMEYPDGDTFKYFDKWRELISSTTEKGTFNPPVKYKRDVKFIRLDSLKNDVIVHTFKNYFVSGVAESANDYEGNTVVKYNITLTGDDVEYNNNDDQIIASNITESDFLTSINKAKSKKQSLLDIFLF